MLFMPPKEEKPPKTTSTKKKNKSKRKAVSPLNDEAIQSSVTAVGGVTGGRKVKTKYESEQSTGGTVKTLNTNMSNPNSGQSMAYNNSQTQFMNSASAPMHGQAQNSPMFMYPSPLSNQGLGQLVGPGVGPPPCPPQTLSFTSPPSRPEWLNEITEDIKTIKLSINNIDQTVSNINMKVTQLESKITAIDRRVEEVEKCCSFVSDKYESQKNDLKNTKSDIKAVENFCKTMEEKNKELDKQKERMDSKLLELERRSMRENLMFFGIEESEDEENDCSEIIMKFCRENLKMQQADIDQIKLDRAHRMGAKRRNSVRPIVVKFHYYTDREKVRIKGVGLREELKRNNQSVRAQWPKEVLDKRKTLYPIMNREKELGKSVKFVREKLFINGEEYKPE